MSTNSSGSFHTSKLYLDNGVTDYAALSSSTVTSTYSLNMPATSAAGALINDGTGNLGWSTSAPILTNATGDPILLQLTNTNTTSGNAGVAIGFTTNQSSSVFSGTLVFDANVGFFFNQYVKVTNGSTAVFEVSALNLSDTSTVAIIFTASVSGTETQAQIRYGPSSGNCQFILEQTTQRTSATTMTLGFQGIAAGGETRLGTIAYTHAAPGSGSFAVSDPITIVENNSTGLLALTLSNTNTTANAYASMQLSVGNGSTVSQINLLPNYDGTDSSHVSLLSDTSLGASPDNGPSCGTANHRWSVIYSATAVINTSDGTLKKDIEPLVLGLDFLAKLQPISYRMKCRGQDKDGTELPGKRKHFGFDARQVEQVLIECGLNTEDCAMICVDNSKYAMRYEHLIPVLVRSLVDLRVQFEAFKSRVGSPNSTGSWEKADW